MVSKQSVEAQLKRIHFNHRSWGSSEAQELPNIILPDETILECVNGTYEGGFALLVATDMRVLLVDKKPMNYLTVEDLRFDMISEIDYSHRLFGARINISTGSKNLKFTSVNQPRLRKLIGHVQNHMATIKKVQHSHQEDQKAHLEQINQQLQTYLIAQHQQQEALKLQLEKANNNLAAVTMPEPVEMSPELKDFMLAKRLMSEQVPEYVAPPQAAVVQQIPAAAAPSQPQPEPQQAPVRPQSLGDSSNPQLADLYAEGMQEIFGRRPGQQAAAAQPVQPQLAATPPAHALEVNPIRIAYSKLPMALRNRKFGRPSFHAHSQQPAQPQMQPSPTPQS